MVLYDQKMEKKWAWNKVENSDWKKSKHVSPKHYYVRILKSTPCV